MRWRAPNQIEWLTASSKRGKLAARGIGLSDPTTLASERLRWEWGDLETELEIRAP